MQTDISFNPPSHFVTVPLNVTSEMVAQFNLTNKSQPLTSAVLLFIKSLSILWQN